MLIIWYLNCSLSHDLHVIYIGSSCANVSEIPHVVQNCSSYVWVNSFELLWLKNNSSIAPYRESQNMIHLHPSWWDIYPSGKAQLETEKHLLQEANITAIYSSQRWHRDGNHYRYIGNPYAGSNSPWCHWIPLSVHAAKVSWPTQVMAEVGGKVRMKCILPGKLTYPLNINGWKMYFLLKGRPLLGSRTYMMQLHLGQTSHYRFPSGGKAWVYLVYLHGNVRVPPPPKKFGLFKGNKALLRPYAKIPHILDFDLFLNS